MNTDTYAIMCGIIVIGVRVIVEAKRPASFLKKLIFVYLTDILLQPGMTPSDLLDTWTT